MAAFLESANPVKHYIWEFLRKPDGTYAVTHNGQLLSDSIPEKFFATQICEQFGFCGQASQSICDEVDRAGMCRVDLKARNPFPSRHDE